MKHRYILIALILSVLSSCNSERHVIYDGPDYIMFSDTLYTFGILDSGEYFDIPICATKPCDYDRNVAVEIVERQSNAIDGYQYSLESPTVVIPAGSLVANVRVKGFPENMNAGDSLGFVLNLITDEDLEWDLYGTKTSVRLVKCCPFDRNAFVGPLLVTSSYAMSYMNSYYRVTYSVADPDDDNGVIIKDFLYDGYDIRVHLENEDRLNPILQYDEQVMAGTDIAFGTKYGDGNLLMTEPTGYVSYYSTCENFLAVYMRVYVKDVGTVGLYVNVCERISEEEAARLKAQGY